MADKLDLGLPKYMGRGIIAGLTVQGEPAAIYFMEGRSPPSRKRKFVPYPAEGRVHVDTNSQTSLEQLRQEALTNPAANPDLLLYNAMQGSRDGLLVVSNGFQTDCDPVWEGEGREAENLRDSLPGGGIYHRIRQDDRRRMEDAIERSLQECGSEVDPLRTARIAYAADFEQSPDRAAVGIVVRPREGGKMEESDRLRIGRWAYFTKGSFVMFATYGVHDPPYYAALPPLIFTLKQWTREVRLEGTTPEQLVEEVWEALPKEILVGVAAAMKDYRQQGGFSFAVKNMEE